MGPLSCTLPSPENLASPREVSVPLVVCGMVPVHLSRAGLYVPTLTQAGSQCVLPILASQGLAPPPGSAAASLLSFWLCG